MSETSSENSRNTNLNTHIFPYRTLAPGEIRVLTIHPPRTTDRNEPIRCSLDHCPLLPSSAARTFPRYEWGDYFALSYCWGADAQNPSRKITIDDHAVKVTENLEAALQTLRASSMSTAGPWPVRFWVDAVCLNQSDSEEVKAEILRMRDIYSQAAGVYSHLGLATEDSDVGFRFMHLMAEGLFQSADMVYRELVDRRFSGKDPEKNAYKAMLRLLNRPYWHRVWVLQELAMS
ncbi:HET-domain-containing protein, partial [Bimuria novae-zelandiae CBS 107.79]